MSWLTQGVLSLLLLMNSFTMSAQSIVAQPDIPLPTTNQVAVAADMVPLIQPLAGSALVVDLTTGREIYAKNADQARPMASLTKLMTALVVMRSHALSDTVTIDPAVQSLDGTGSQVLNLVPGDKLSLDQALHGLLINSANDMAVSLATWDAGSETAFVAKMNQTAEELGLKQTHFANSHGLDAVNHVSSARDMAKLSEIVLQSPTVRDIVKQRTGQFTTQLGKSYRFTTTNALLVNSTVQGLKTGFTAAAGQCLIAYAVRDGHAILTVVLGSSDRFADSSSLIQSVLGK